MHDAFPEIVRYLTIIAVADPTASRDCQVLAVQAALAGFEITDNTSAGLYAKVVVPPGTAPAQTPSQRIGNIQILIVGMEHGAGMIVYVDDGFITLVEVHTFGDDLITGWQQNIVGVRFAAVRKPPPPAMP